MSKQVKAKPLSKKEANEWLPLCFKDYPEVVEKVLELHPEMSKDLKKALLKFMSAVDKVSTKHGVQLGSEVFFVLLMEGVSHGQ